jgi:hypothetical protein
MSRLDKELEAKCMEISELEISNKKLEEDLLSIIKSLNENKKIEEKNLLENNEDNIYDKENINYNENDNDNENENDLNINTNIDILENGIDGNLEGNIQTSFNKKKSIDIQFDFENENQNQNEIEKIEKNNKEKDKDNELKEIDKKNDEEEKLNTSVRLTIKNLDNTNTNKRTVMKKDKSMGTLDSLKYDDFSAHKNFKEKLENKQNTEDILSKLNFLSNDKYFDIDRDSIIRDSSILFRSESKRVKLNNEENLFDSDKQGINESKILERNKSQKDFIIMDMFNKFKKEKNISTSMTFNNLENFLKGENNNFNYNIFDNKNKVTVACQTGNWDDYDHEDKNENDNLDIYNKKDINKNKINRKLDLDNIDEFNEFEYDYYDDNDNDNNNNNNKNFEDVIKRIENLNEKLQKEGKIIENMNSNKANLNNNEKFKGKELNDNINNNIDIEKSEVILNVIKDELNNLLLEINKKTNKENMNNNSNSNFLKKSKKTLKKKSNIYLKEDLDNLLNENKKEFDLKFNSEKNKHENEKKTILKVLEEKCEKYNMVEIENADLIKKIKLLEVKMTPDEKKNKKMFMILEKNIEQLNLNLENCAAEKTKISINHRVLEKKLYARNIEMEKINKELNDLKEQVRIYFLFFNFL